jgi:hypothetical protein
MPLVSFNPTKARLVIEEGKESVLVMKVVVAKGESVELATGGKLESLTGVLRVREYKADTGQGNGKGIGSLVFVPSSGPGKEQQAAKFQINILMSAKKFDALLQVALSGRLPTKFFVSAGERVSRAATKGLSYRKGPKGQTKIWDNKSFRSLLVTNFVLILPISVSERQHAVTGNAEPDSIDETASSSQVAELADDLAAFQSQTHHILVAIVMLFAVSAILVLIYNVIQLLRPF